MLTVYTCGGPNPRKVTILLEALHWQYNCKLVDLYQGQNRLPEYLAVNPNGRLPALVDDDGPGGKPILIWESGAILQYIAERAERFLPTKGAARYEVLKWLNFQVAHAPYLGNAHLYRTMYRDAMPFDIKRFTIESRRIYQVLEDQLAVSPFVAGDEYSIADMAWYPWIEYHDWQGQVSPTSPPSRNGSPNSASARRCREAARSPGSMVNSAAARSVPNSRT